MTERHHGFLTNSCSYRSVILNLTHALGSGAMMSEQAAVTRLPTLNSHRLIGTIPYKATAKYVQSARAVVY